MEVAVDQNGNPAMVKQYFKEMERKYIIRVSVKATHHEDWDCYSVT